MTEAGISLVVSTERPSYPHGDSLVLRIELTNSNNEDIQLTLPAGADTSKIFSYKLVDVDTKKVYPVSEFSPRSFAADWRRTVKPREVLSIKNGSLRFQVGDAWQVSPPPGTYRIICTFDERKANKPEQRGFLVLEAETPPFSVKQ